MWLYILVAALIILLFAIAYLIFDFIFGKKAQIDMSDHAQLLQSPWFGFEKQISGGIRWINKQKWRDVEIISRDGLRLYGRWLEKPGSDKVALLFHGYNSMGHNDFSVSARHFFNNGFSILMPDQRAHGKSEGKYRTFGALESDDCRLWADKSLELAGRDAKLLLAGVSMGATTVLLSLKKELPKNVKCIIADCGFTCPKAIVSWQMKHKYRIYAFPMLQLVGLYCTLFAHFTPSHYDTREALKENEDIPVFLIHGKADNIVPFSMSEENEKACSAAHGFFISENAMHAGSALTEGERYFKEIDAFISKYF